FYNAEMGLQAVFPAGSEVCMSRSGDAPRGFYARYGATGIGCPEVAGDPAAFMGISSSFNALFVRSLRKAARHCPPLSRDVRRRLHGVSLSIPGHRSLACERDRLAGAVE